MSLTQAIKDEARRLGFELVGVTLPAPPEHFDVFTHWLEAGRAGEMGYLDSDRSRERRGDPRRILPECRSILVLGIRYASLEGETLRTAQNDYYSPNNVRKGHTDEAKLTGRIAAYAWGEDYHEVLAPKMEALTRFIEAEYGEPVLNRWYTDTGPILERDLAQRAGLGWIGKNTCLIHPRKGSYFLLAEILLGIDLEPDTPFVSDHCGTCTRCLEACPTSCILPDRTLDASRCISYLTIELKGAIPQELRSQIGEWVFGCDVCQQVCPWNQRFAEEEGEPAFATREPAPRPNLLIEMALSANEFNKRFKGSPVKHAKRRGYLRNVAVALGNAGNPAAMPILSHALEGDPEPLVRGHAAWALGQIGGEEARQALLHALEMEQESYVQAEIRSALERLNSGME